MNSVDAIDQLLESTAEEQKQKQAQAGKHSGDERRSRERDDRDNRDRDRRHDRDRRDRSRDRNNPRRHRESDRGDRDRSRDRERRRRDDSRPRSSYKDSHVDTDEEERRRGGRRGGGDYYSGGSRRDRSRSPNRRDDRGGRYRDRSRDRRRADDRPAPRRTATPEPEVTEDDRDKRTIFVQQISQRAETRHLRSFFEAVGPVVEAQIVKDRVTGRSKGVGYVEFKQEESVPKAIELTGQKLKGVPIIAQHTEAEKNRASRATETNPTNGNSAPFHRLYVGNIHFSVTEDDLSAVFSPFGVLEQVTLQKEDASGGGRSKGYGFVQFRDPNAAKSALEQMNGFELASRPIRVGLGNDKFTPESTANLLRNFNSQAQSFQGSAFSGAGGRGAYAGGSGGVFDRTHGRDDRGAGASALDDTDVAGINFNNVNRDRLMHLLAREPVEEPNQNRAKAQASARSRPAVQEQQPSKCVKIQGAFDPEDELKKYGPNWAKELEGEVKNECDVKYGKVVHLAVDPNTDGDIYVKFDSVTGGERALQGLNGRSFNYRTLRASYVVDKIYNSLFGAAASKF